MEKFVLKTKHDIIFKNSGKMKTIPDGSVDLVVTSPPYPMIEMWDDMFFKQAPSIKKALTGGKPVKAFELMHKQLDRVWGEVFRVLKWGGFACINIGDATRTVNANFQLFPNHSRILQCLMELGFSVLPDILWRKQTNAPNKFMGSGMLPAGAYVTLEHEYILIVRKGSKREFFKEADKVNRRESAIFWEERNIFFSDVWMDIKGTTQTLFDKESRTRSAAYPFELAYRLVSMYSARNDTVLDPFFGTGTTMAAAMAAGRNSIGYETDNGLKNAIDQMLDGITDFANNYIYNRLSRHIDFITDRIKQNKPIKYVNSHYGFPVVTNQEKVLILNDLGKIKPVKQNTFEVSYLEKLQPEFCKDWSNDIHDCNIPKKAKKRTGKKKKGSKSTQLELFK